MVMWDEHSEMNTQQGCRREVVSASPVGSLISFFFTFPHCNLMLTVLRKG